MTNLLRNRYILAAAALAMVTVPLSAQQAQQPPAGAVPPLQQAGTYSVGQAVPDAEPGTNLLSLTLDQAIQMALEKNLELKVARMNPQSIDYQLASARAAFNPSFTGSYSYSDQASPNNNNLEGAQNVKNTSQGYNAGVSQNLLFHGSSVSASFTNSRGATNSTQTVRNPTFSSGLAFSFNMPLLAGFAVPQNAQTLRTIPIQRQVADITLVQTIERTKASVRTAYWALRQAIESIEIQKRSLALARQLHQDNLTRVEIGTMASIETLTAETQVVNGEQALQQAEITFQTAQMTLKRLLADSPDDAIYKATINPTELPALSVQEVDIEAAVRRAVSDRTDVVSSRRNLDVTKINLEQTKDALKPNLALTSSYRASGQGGPQYSKGVLTVPGGYGQALTSVMAFDVPTWSVGLNMTYPLGMASARATYARSVLGLEQSQAQLQALELDVTSAVRTAGLNVRNAYKQYQVSQRAREVAEKNADAEQVRFGAGMQTNYNVVTAQNNLTQQRLNELNALIRYINALADFERLQRVP